MKVKHPETGQVVDTDADHAHMYTSQGWEIVTKPARATPGTQRHP